MIISRLMKVQLVLFMVISFVAITIMAVVYLKLPTMLFGAGRYTVTVQLPEAAGLYRRGNVTYRGSQVGQVKEVRLTDDGVVAVLSLVGDVRIPSNLQAQVHSVSAIGEQYVDLVPRDAVSPPLKDGDVIATKDTKVPVDVNTLLDTTNRGLEAIPGDNLQTVIEESYTGLGGLGPELSRIVDGATALSAGAHENLDSLTTLIDQSPPLLDSQTNSADALHAWAANMADVTDQLRAHDDSLSSLLPAAARLSGEGKQLIDRLQLSVPVLLANLVSVADVAVTYRADIEQLLVLFPQMIAGAQAGGLATRDQKDHTAINLPLAFFNTNLPPPCLTGYLPQQQRRSPALTDSPDRPEGDLYCRVPQDSPWSIRGARNIPCETRPGKRAPTVKMCESDEQYVPLNEGFNWKGDPNATLSGQDVPQLPPGTPTNPNGMPPAAAPPPVAVAEYDPATGSYVGPDGEIHSQSNLTQHSPPTWQSMLIPPAG